MNEELSSLRFDGVGKCKGGIFDNVNISGTGKIEGSVKCSKFDSSGSAKVFGTTECNEFFTSGLSKVEGNILASKVEISGLLRCTGNIKFPAPKNIPNSIDPTKIFWESESVRFMINPF